MNCRISFKSKHTAFQLKNKEFAGFMIAKLSTKKTELTRKNLNNYDSSILKDILNTYLITYYYGLSSITY